MGRAEGARRCAACFWEGEDWLAAASAEVVQGWGTVRERWAKESGWWKVSAG